MAIYTAAWEYPYLGLQPLREAFTKSSLSLHFLLLDFVTVKGTSISISRVLMCLWTVKTTPFAHVLQWMWHLETCWHHAHNNHQLQISPACITDFCNKNCRPADGSHTLLCLILPLICLNIQKQVLISLL